MQVHFNFQKRYLKRLLFTYIFELFQDRAIMKDTTNVSLDEIFTTIFMDLQGVYIT